MARSREEVASKRTLPGAHRRWRSKARASHELGASVRLGFGDERFEDTPFVVGEVVA